MGWSSKKTCLAVGLGLLVVSLAVAVIVLGVLLGNEMAANTCDEPVTPTGNCTTSACVLAAGAILEAMDKTADPCDDFYQYACGGYHRANNIPSGYSRYGSFDQARNVVQKDLRKLLEETPPAGEKEARAKSRRFYKSCLDTNTTTNEGKDKLVEIVSDIGGFFLKAGQVVPDAWNLEDLLEKRNSYTTSGFFSFYVSVDNKDVTYNVIQVSQGGLGLGSNSRDYYVGKDVDSDRILVAYAEMMETYAKLLIGDVDLDLIKDIIRFEKTLAENMLDTATMRDPSIQYNMKNATWLNEIMSFLDWHQFFQSAFNLLTPPIVIQEDEPVVMFATDYFTNLTEIMNDMKATKDGQRTLQNYAVMRAVMSYAPSFGDEFKAASEKFQAVFSGKQGSLPQWQTCVSATDSAIGFALGAIYIDKYFTEAGKAKAEAIIKSVKATFKRRIDDVEWMDDVTRKEALEKIDKLVYEAAYPNYVANDTYLDTYYSPFVVSDTSYVDSQMSLFKFSYNEEFGVLRKQPDKTKWYMTPQTVNAYYSATQNKFVVPGGILTPPFFYQADGIPWAINYAAIGTVIGHEIGHGFDDKGSQYDGDGNLNNWWTNETRHAFVEKAQCLVDQYEEYEVDGLHLRGQQTLGENIGDNGGLRASYQAYKSDFQSATDDTVLVGFADMEIDQLFFVSYAQVWCSLYTPESMKSQILMNVHSPGNFRVIGPVSNHPDFASAFNCKAGDAMNPADKCTVW